jgi:hypothetical protein
MELRAMVAEEVLRQVTLQALEKYCPLIWIGA